MPEKSSKRLVGKWRKTVWKVVAVIAEDNEKKERRGWGYVKVYMDLSLASRPASCFKS